MRCVIAIFALGCLVLCGCIRGGGIEQSGAGNRSSVDNRLATVDADLDARVSARLDAALAKLTTSSGDQRLTTSQPASADGEGATADSSSKQASASQSGIGNIAINVLSGASAGIGSVVLWMAFYGRADREETKRLLAVVTGMRCAYRSGGDDENGRAAPPATKGDADEPSCNRT